VEMEDVDAASASTGELITAQLLLGGDEGRGPRAHRSQAESSSQRRNKNPSRLPWNPEGDIARRSVGGRCGSGGGGAAATGSHGTSLMETL